MRKKSLIAAALIFSITLALASTAIACASTKAEDGSTHPTSANSAMQALCNGNTEYKQLCMTAMTVAT